MELALAACAACKLAPVCSCAGDGTVKQQHSSSDESQPPSQLQLMRGQTQAGSARSITPLSTCTYTSNTHNEHIPDDSSSSSEIGRGAIAADFVSLTPSRFRCCCTCSRYRLAQLRHVLVQWLEQRHDDNRHCCCCCSCCAVHRIASCHAQQEGERESSLSVTLEISRQCTRELVHPSVSPLASTSLSIGLDDSSSSSSVKAQPQ